MYSIQFHTTNSYHAKTFHDYNSLVTEMGENEELIIIATNRLVSSRIIDRQKYQITSDLQDVTISTLTRKVNVINSFSDNDFKVFADTKPTDKELQERYIGEHNETQSI